MKRILMCFLVGVLWPAAVCTGASVPAKVEDTTIAVYFSPKGGCTGAIVGLLKDAKRTVLVQAYSLASAPIANALVEAQWMPNTLSPTTRLCSATARPS